MEYRGSNPKKTTPIISATRAFKMLKKGCQGYLCTVQMAETLEPNLKEILVVQEFLGVLQEVPELPPNR